MTRIPKSALSLAAGALAVGVLLLAAPRAAHALAAALVQVTNTPANPAITQDVARQAAQLIDLTSAASASISVPSTFNSVMPSGQRTPNYSVPANQFLVITGVDITPYCSALNTVLLSDGFTSRKFWSVSGLNTIHFEYPSGIVLAEGSSPNISAFIDPSSSCGVFMDMHGYLTSN